MRDESVGRGDGLQRFVGGCEKVDLGTIFIAHPECTVNIEDKPFWVGREMGVVGGGDWILNGGAVIGLCKQWV